MRARSFETSRRHRNEGSPPWTGPEAGGAPDAVGARAFGGVLFEFVVGGGGDSRSVAQWSRVLTGGHSTGDFIRDGERRGLR